MAFYERKQGTFGFAPNTQMNITALVDVTLVTLIIYILVSPALEHGIDVQLPQATPRKLVTLKPAVISMSTKGPRSGTRSGSALNPQHTRPL